MDGKRLFFLSQPLFTLTTNKDFARPNPATCTLTAYCIPLTSVLRWRHHRNFASARVQAGCDDGFFNGRRRHFIVARWFDFGVLYGRCRIQDQSHIRLQRLSVRWCGRRRHAALPFTISPLHCSFPRFLPVFMFTRIEGASTA